MSSDGDQAPQDTSSTITVSAIDINLARDSRKTIESISIKLQKSGRKTQDVAKTVSIQAGHGHREKFGQPLDLDPKSHIFVTVNCRLLPLLGRKRTRNIEIDIDLGDTEYREDQGVRSFRKKVQSVEVIVTGGRKSLPGTVASIIESCSRFRLLVIGNSGVGKSSLIRKVFGVEEVKTTSDDPDIADIDREFVSPTNERFVIHDSLGFEAGDEESMKKVEDFVTRRRAEPQQIHAVWLCLDIPYAGGRLLEGGVEAFLERRNEILGAIPLVVVLTKVDKLDTQLKPDIPENGDVKQSRKSYLDENCISPLHQVAGNDVPYVTVSVQEGYSDSVSDLIATTLESMVEQNGEGVPRTVAAIAQRVSIKEKIELSITIGRKKYWETLLKGAVPRDHTVQDLQVIRKDTIAIWNFYDPDQCLMDDMVIKYLLRTDNLGKSPEELSSSDLLGQTLASALQSRKSRHGDASLPIGDIGISIGTYLGAKHDVKILMAYIVDLICTMQIIFLLASGSRVTPNMLALALGAYEQPRITVHEEVDKFDGKQSPDRALDEVERLIRQYNIVDDKIEELKKIIHDQPSGSV